jgi:AMIN domain-containing protein
MTLRQLRFRDNGHAKRSSCLWATPRVAAFWLTFLPVFLWGNPQAPGAPGTSSPDSAVPANVPAAVQHVKLLLDKGNPALEIETTLPVTPQINKSNEGMRLVIDLPNTNMSVADKVVPIKNRDLSEMRLNLVDSNPPRVHVEIDFRMPLGYTWDTAGNRLLVSFHEASKDDIDNNNAAAPSTGAAGASPLPVSAPAAAPDFAHVINAEQLSQSASVAAGSETAVLRIKRLGDVYVCPQTSVSVVHSKNGPDLTLALNDGGLETHLALKNSADEVVTPDFRILLRGPGEFHYAIRADSRGNTCVRTLPGNTASAIIYELLGDGTYNVQAQDQIVFRDGKLSPANAAAQSGSVLPLECGCPPPPPATLLASTKPEPRLAVELPSADPPPVASRPDPVSSAVKDKDAVAPGSPATPETAAEIRDLPEAMRQQPHLAVEASLSFTPNPARRAAMSLPVSSRELSSPVDVLPPSPPPAPERHKTVFGKIKSFFSRAFQ